MDFRDLFHVTIEVVEQNASGFLDEFITSFGISLGTVAVGVLVYILIMLAKFFIVWIFPMRANSSFFNLNFDLSYRRRLVFFPDKFRKWYKSEFGAIDWKELANELKGHILYSGEIDLPITMSTRRILVMNEDELLNVQGKNRQDRLNLLLELKQINEGRTAKVVIDEENRNDAIFELTLDAIENIEESKENENLFEILENLHKKMKMNEYYGRERVWWKKILTLKISELPLESKHK